MKMYGYISKNGKFLYVRNTMKNAELCLIVTEMRRLRVNHDEAKKYVREHFNEVEIEYNEVT